ncbi:MAG: hypothetical protein QXX95_05390 [Nitrososphaerales archaeon]
MVSIYPIYANGTLRPADTFLKHRMNSSYEKGPIEAIKEIKDRIELFMINTHQEERMKSISF